MTRQKKLILEILRASHSHPTAAEIYDAARRQLPNISLGTVYRNLASLCDAGEAVCLTSVKGPDRYDVICDGHWHAACSVCGKIVDIPADPELLARLSGRCGDGMTPRGIWVECVCDKCSAAAPESAAE